MKRIILTAALLLGALGLKAQDCDAIMLPYFNNNKSQMENYKNEAREKFDCRCTFAITAFSEEDVLPEGVKVYDISDVKDRFTGAHLPSDFVVDLRTLSYYGYNFSSFHDPDDIMAEVYFRTPGSAHPYLKLHSSAEMNQVASRQYEEAVKKM